MNSAARVGYVQWECNRERVLGVGCTYPLLVRPEFNGIQIPYELSF